MSKPSQSRGSNEYFDRVDVRPFEYFFIRDKVVPFNPEYSSQTPLMEHLKPLHPCLGSVPDLTTIKEYCQHSRFIYSDLSRCLDIATVPYTAEKVECS